MIRKCLINKEGSVRANHSYGPDIPLIQGGMKRRKNPYNRVTRVPLPTYICCTTIILNSIMIFYENNDFPPYKVIQDHFPQSRKLHSKERGQHHQIIEHSQQNLQGKRLQHRRFPWRQ